MAKAVHLSRRQELDVWRHMGLLLNGHPANPEGGPMEWKQGAIPDVDVVNNKSVAAYLTTTIGYTVTPHNVDSLRRLYGYDFRDKRDKKPPRPEGEKRRSKRSLIYLMVLRLEGAYTDLYEWATRQGYTGRNRLTDMKDTDFQK